MTERSAKARHGADVFSDLGFSAAEAENLRIRSALMRALVSHIRKNDLTQAQAAKSFGISQPRVSDLMRGKIHLFSIDNLMIPPSLAEETQEFWPGEGRYATPT